MHYDRLDVVMLSKLAGDYATGIYGAAYRSIGMVQLLPYGVLYSLLPELTRGDVPAHQRERLEKAMGLLLGSAFVIVLATMVFADVLAPALLGARFSESATALKILIWAVILRYINYALNVKLLANGQERVFVMTSGICLAVNVIGNLVFIPMFSWRAAAALTIAIRDVYCRRRQYVLLGIAGARGAAQGSRPARWRLQRRAWRQAGGGCHPRSSGHSSGQLCRLDARSRSTSTAAARRTASGCRRWAARRTT